RGDDVERRQSTGVPLFVERLPLLERGGRHQAFSSEHALASAATDRDHGNVVTLRTERSEFPVESETRCDRVGKAGPRLRDVGPRDAVMGRIGLAVDADLDAANAFGIDGPPRDVNAGPGDDFTGRGVD